jgi:hypothetical protein
VFARRANPRVDPPILRKSKSYVEDQVRSGLADLVDPTDLRKGIICRETLYFGEREFRPVEKEQADNMPHGEIPGVRFVGPRNPIPHFVSSVGPNSGWDWSLEPAAVQ